MKLLSENEESHFPDATQALQPWYVQRFKRWITRLFSAAGITISVGVLLVLLLTGIISMNFLNTDRGIDRNGISLMDFHAPSRLEILDRAATQRKIDRTKQTIKPIYQPQEPHNDDISENLRKFLSAMGILATDPHMAQNDKFGRFQQIAGNIPDADNLFNRYFVRPLPVNDWVKISQASQQAMANILNAGFTEADEQVKRDFVIRQSIAQLKNKPAAEDLLYFILDATLEPNLILDEPVMKHQQDEVSARIYMYPEIRIFNKGEKIIGKGEKVTPVEMAALSQMGKTASSNNWIACIGILLLVSLFVYTLWNYLFNFKQGQFFKPAYAALISTLILMTTLFFHLQDSGVFGDVPLYAFPLGAIALSLAIFTHTHISVLATTLLVFLLALTMRGDFQSLSILLFGSYMGIYILKRQINHSNRLQLIYAGFYIGATHMLILMAISLVKPGFNSLAPAVQASGVLSWGDMGLKMLISLSSGIFSGILTIGSLPLLEGLFHLITPYTLMELGNHDQPLLKRMQFDAPGTFHHSLMVATLAEAAAESIEADALLTRVGCLYHDIGKMKRPLFFIENQAYFGVENPHDKLTPRLSKMVITAHPRDSLEMARQHKLPEMLMSFMTEHHGTLTAGYFYNKACMDEGAENVNKSQFRYPGPKPASRETAIVMLADAAESAVRALKNPTVAQVEERIDKIIQQRIEDGQFDNCPITFQDMHLIKKTFVRILRGIQHNRIEYQQNMMRELGRKLPPGTLQEAANAPVSAAVVNLSNISPSVAGNKIFPLSEKGSIKEPEKGS